MAIEHTLPQTALLSAPEKIQMDLSVGQDYVMGARVLHKPAEVKVKAVYIEVFAREQKKHSWLSIGNIDNHVLANTVACKLHKYSLIYEIIFN